MQGGKLAFGGTRWLEKRLNGMSQKYLAKMVGLSSQGLLKIEKRTVSPEISIIEKICDVLCITPNQLLGIEQITKENSSFIERLKRLR